MGKFTHYQGSFIKSLLNHIILKNRNSNIDFLKFLPYNISANKVIGFENIEGRKTIEFNEGKAQFSSLKIYAKPDAEIFFKITSSSITRYYSEYLLNDSNISDQNLNNNYAFVFSIKFRKCQRGEIFFSQINRFIIIFIF